jgi:hypothetical protein
VKSIRLIIFILGFFVSLAAQEQGFLIMEETTVPPLFGRPQKVIITKTWVAGNHIRKDIGENKQTWIFHSDTSEVWMINHSERTYTILHSDVFQGLAVMAFMTVGTASDSDDGIVKVPDQMFKETGRTLNISGWNCVEVVAKSNGTSDSSRLTLWMSRQTGLDSRMFSKIFKRMMGDNHQYDHLFEQIEALGGYPVLIESRMMGGRVKQELLSVEKRIVTDSLFELPKGYTRKESSLNE